jgi:hypothetical protein
MLEQIRKYKQLAELRFWNLKWLSTTSSVPRYKHSKHSNSDYNSRWEWHLYPSFYTIYQLSTHPTNPFSFVLSLEILIFWHKFWTLEMLIYWNGWSNLLLSGKLPKKTEGKTVEEGLPVRSLCTGVRRWLIVRWVRRLLSSWMERQLRALWLAGKWVWARLFRSGCLRRRWVWIQGAGARGASPADSSSAFASSCSSVQVLVAALFKALWGWGYSSSMGGGWLPASAGGDGIWRMRPAEVPRTF